MAQETGMEHQPREYITLSQRLRMQLRASEAATSVYPLEGPNTCSKKPLEGTLHLPKWGDSPQFLSNAGIVGTGVHITIQF